MADKIKIVIELTREEIREFELMAEKHRRKNFRTYNPHRARAMAALLKACRAVGPAVAPWRRHITPTLAMPPGNQLTPAPA